MEYNNEDKIKPLPWQQELDDLRNTKKNLIKKAELLCGVIVKKSSLKAMILEDAFRSEKKVPYSIRRSFKKANWSDIISEFVFLFLHITDRYAFSFLTENQREIFIDHLTEIVIEDASEASGNSFETMRRWFNTRSLEYSKYQEIIHNPDKDESPKGALNWEFAKKITNAIVGYNHPFISTIIAGEVALDVAMLNIQGLLSYKKHEIDTAKQR